eukprot:gb/GEZN01026966.1/.p2 GENE.gb/GEZN01026966.1/~~gb/GEZN01026966.1/.p2  ORF type:complete len:124 (+),score=8.36 gb/GEZN01026966.1/:42-374(+)
MSTWVAYLPPIPGQNDITARELFSRFGFLLDLNVRVLCRLLPLIAIIAQTTSAYDFRVTLDRVSARYKDSLACVAAAGSMTANQAALSGILQAGVFALHPWISSIALAPS